MSLILSPTALLGTLTSALGSSASASSGSKFQDLLQQAQAAAASGSDGSDGTGNGVSGSSGSTGSASGSHLSRAERRQKEDEARLAQARQDLADYMGSCFSQESCSLTTAAMLFLNFSMACCCLREGVFPCSPWRTALVIKASICFCIPSKSF